MKTDLKQMKIIGSIFLMIICSYSLKGQTEFEKADSIAMNLETTFDNPKDLAAELTESLSSDMDKARVLFMWIAHNIRYDCKQFHNPRKATIEASTKAELMKKRQAWEKKQINRTIKYKKGICGDYSNLYKALCDEVGLEAVVITGDARNFHRPYRNKYENPHAWNAVKIDGEWHLMETTWAAGNVDGAVTKFSRNISPGFFSVDPKWFVQSHFPEDEKWQLLAKPISKDDFTEQPLINYGQEKYRIKNFSSKLEKVKKEKDRKQIWLEFENAPEILYLVGRKGKKIKFKRTEKEGKIILSFLASVSKNVAVYGGEPSQKIMSWFAKYEL